eukprot:GEMP01087174.1.p1 GENE.GEMP01087174.1~~GEMP01087174.1.p1  ORF type:complete len:160 (-),score=17.96 GEMP01087174.1:21-500(-)
MNPFVEKSSCVSYYYSSYHIYEQKTKNMTLMCFPSWKKPLGVRKFAVITEPAGSSVTEVIAEAAASAGFTAIALSAASAATLSVSLTATSTVVVESAVIPEAAFTLITKVEALAASASASLSFAATAFLCAFSGKVPCFTTVVARAHALSVYVCYIKNP